jgi:hypothetical protein
MKVSSNQNDPHPDSVQLTEENRETLANQIRSLLQRGLYTTISTHTLYDRRVEEHQKLDKVDSSSSTGLIIISDTYGVGSIHPGDRVHITDKWFTYEGYARSGHYRKENYILEEPINETAK